MLWKERAKGTTKRVVRVRAQQREGREQGSAKRGDEDVGNLDYFGVLTYIIELTCFDGNNVILFKCDWWDVSSKKKKAIRKITMDSF